MCLENRKTKIYSYLHVYAENMQKIIQQTSNSDLPLGRGNKVIADKHG